MSYNLSVLTTASRTIIEPTKWNIVMNRPSILWFSDGHLPIVHSLYEWKVGFDPQEGSLVLIDVLGESKSIQARVYVPAIEHPTWAHFMLGVKQEVIKGIEGENERLRSHITRLEASFYELFKEVAHKYDLWSFTPQAAAQKLFDQKVISDLPLYQKVLAHMLKHMR